MARRSRVTAGTVVLMLLGALLGFAAGAYLGTWVFGWLLEVAGEASGWTDLAAVAGSMLTFGPVGAALGMVAGLRPALDPDQRRWLIAAVATAAAAGVVIWFSVGLVEAVAVGLWSVALALILWMVSAVRRR